MGDDTKPSKQMGTLHTIVGLVGFVATGLIVFKIWQSSWLWALLAVIPVFIVVMILQFILMAPLFRRTPEGKLKAEMKQAIKEGRIEEAGALAEEYRRKFNPAGEAGEAPAGEGDISEQMMQMAAMQVEAARRHFSMELDFSEASLGEIDRAISEFHSGPALSEATYVTYLAYVGEVVRRNLGGQWVDDPERGPMVLSEEPSFGVFPYAWVKKRFEDGEDESIVFKYLATKKLVKGEEALSDVSPDSSVPQMSFNTGSSAMSDAMARAPALIFMMVGGADGEIDEEKIAVLNEVIDGIEGHPCRLFEGAITMMSAEVESQFSEGYGSPVIVVSELSEMRAEVEKVFPDQVDELCQALYDFGEKVARHPTGQVSDPAAAALRLVGAGLALSEKR